MMTILAMAVLLGVVILVHEWGHFAAARLCGIRVDVFSIGFGPRIWGWKRGHTDYRVSILPLGGYVKMAGDNPMEERAGEPDEFLSRPRWQRAIVAVAGPVMNIVLTLVVAFILFWHWGLAYPAYLDEPAVIAAFPKNAVGSRAGLLPGDHILSVNETPAATWRQAYEAVGKVEVGDVVHLKVERGPETIAVKFQRAARGEMAAMVGYAPIKAAIAEVAPGKPAAIAGLKSEDLITSVNGEPVEVWDQFFTAVRASQGNPVELKVRRGEDELSFTITPAPGVDELGRNAWQIGIQRKQEPSNIEQVSASQAVDMAFAGLLGGTQRILGVLGGLFGGSVSIKNLGGVIEIGRQAGIAAREGLQRFVELTALISLNLAILNLLPIPILDGGHLLLLAVEGTMRRDLSMAVKERFLQFGMVFLLVIFAIVMYNDVLRLLPRW